MEILSKLRESESIIIEGDKKIGKMVLATYLAQMVAKDAVFVTPLSANKIKRKIASMKKNFLNLEINLHTFSLREDWVLIKNEYGFSYLIKDLEYFISHQQHEVIIFHKIDTIFDYADRDFIDDFFIELLSFGIKYKKKFIFTINVDSVNYDLIGSYLVESSDLYLKMSRPQDKREIEILFSISPIIDSHYIFENVDRKLLLHTKEISGYANKEIDVVVISKDEYIQKVHKYILDKEDINLKIIDSISDSLAIAAEIPDYLIFTQEFDEVNFNVCEISKKNNFKTLYLVNKPFVRVDDRLHGRQKGCVDVISFDMQTMHYILELEKFFGMVFYKNNLVDVDIALDSKESLKKHIQFLLDERALFTIIKIKGKIDKEELDLVRKYDVYMEFDDYSVLLLVNVLKNELKKVVLFHKIQDKLEVLDKQDAIDIFYGEEICID